jgi:2'-5' RNA ligase
LEFSPKLKTFTEELNPLELKFGNIGLFPGTESVLFMSPTVTEELLKVHMKFNNTFSEYRKDMWNYYLPGAWVPHCTLVIDMPKNNLPLAMECILENYQPFNAQVEEIGIVEFRPVKQLSSFKLSK